MSGSKIEALKSKLMSGKIFATTFIINYHKNPGLLPFQETKPTVSKRLRPRSATKIKTQKDFQVFKLRNKERSLIEELHLIKTETTFLKKQLEELKDALTQINHQISMIDICKASEMAKIETQIKNLQDHKKGYQIIFDKERHLLEEYNKKLKEKDAAEEETRKQKEEKIAEKNEQQAREAAAVEEECEALERECTVLKKRNTAIMLKLRRKLVETENIRRDLLKCKSQEIC